MKKVKTIEIKNLQSPEFEELSDSETTCIVGGVSSPQYSEDDLLGFLAGIASNAQGFIKQVLP